MTRSDHHGVVALITNPDRTRFVVQRKDAAYRPAPRGYSLFGGAAEPGESPAQTIARELREELGAAAEALLAAGPRAVVERRTLSTDFAATLFEIVIDAPTLEALADVAVLEGECAVVLDRDALATCPLVWGLGELVAVYLAQLPG
jgi:8-oxo-dGTP pyrophosphatase MutT (NUDIX family)